MRKIILFLLCLMLFGCSYKDNTNDKLDDNTLNVDEPSNNQTIPNEDLDTSLGEIKGFSSKYSSNPTSEPSFNKQLHTINPLGDLSTVWDYYRGDDVVVAVIDSEFDYEHPEFYDSDGNSRVLDTSAYIYTSNGKVTTKVGASYVAITGGDSHGTMCAGLLGSSVNNEGITGVAPNCKLLLIKIDKKSSSFAEAFKYAADNGAKVISTSLGTYPNPNGETGGDVIFPAGEDISKTFNASIKYAYDKGVTIIAATGNSKTTNLSYPAGCDYVIGAGGLNVGSSTQIWDNGYEGSNYNGSKVYVDVFAPSDGIYAPGFNTNTKKSTYWSDGKGTSFAAPLIAGAAALYFEKYPEKTNKDFENALKNTCVNLNSYNGNKNMGWGRIDIGKLLNIIEDVENSEITSSTTVSQTVTNLHIIDEAGWNFRTLHLFDMVFEEGYGYTDFERYLTEEYGKRTATKLYQLEGTKRTWAYTDEGYIGDYYLCVGNAAHASKTIYDYYFPWWVKGFSYQIVNNSNWVPEGGKKISSSTGYGKTVNATFTDKNPSTLSQTIGSSKKININAIEVSFEIIGLNIKVDNQLTSVYDYFEINNLNDKNDKKFIGWFIDEECTILYTKSYLTENIVLYGLYK